MRSPKIILENLQKHSKEDNYKYERLYRNLYNPEFYLQAYQNIYANKGAMTSGIDGMTLDGFGKDVVENLILQIKNHTYQPNPVKRVYIPKKNGKKRPLGISSSADKLVQEVIRMILESIYEPTFSKHSHGFRHDKSCHTALQQIQNTFTGVKWFVEGDIKGYFDNIDHHILVNILRERIKDEAFIELIWKFLKSGYMEKWEYNVTYSGVAQDLVLFLQIFIWTSLINLLRNIKAILIKEIREDLIQNMGNFKEDINYSTKNAGRIGIK